MNQQMTNPMQSAAGRKLQALFEAGQRSGWHGFIGGSISHWLTSLEMREFHSYLNWEAEYRPIRGCQVPGLARECFIVSQQEGIKYISADNLPASSFLVIQVGADGKSYRTLWENHPDTNPPMETNIQLMVHGARTDGPGGVVYHCQPINAIALAALNRFRQCDMLDELVYGFAAVRNVVPDGIDVIPWGMPMPNRRGVSETPQMFRDMEKFIQEIADHTRVHNAVMLDGEGIICAAGSEEAVFGIINTVEHAAEIRLKMLAAAKARNDP